MMFIFTYLLQLFYDFVDYFYIGYCEETEAKRDEIIQLTQEPVITYAELINHNSFKQEDNKKISNDEEYNWELI